jgi:hypothetical protein
MYYQNRSKPKQHNNRINALPSVAATVLGATFASLNMLVYILASYPGCYVPFDGFSYE